MANQSRAADFFNAINEDLQKQVSRIMAEADSIKETQTKSFSEEARQKSAEFYRREVAKITQHTDKKISVAQAKAKKELLENRNRIAQQAFDKAAQKLTEFSASEEYADFLVKSACNIASHFNGGEILFFLRECDMEYSQAISQAVVQQCRFEADPSIKIGGCKAISHSSQLAADDTLDCRLDGQHRWFYENSGLSVSL